MIHWAIVVHLIHEIYEMKINVNIWAMSTSVSLEECLVLCVVKFFCRIIQMTQVRLTYLRF